MINPAVNIIDADVEDVDAIRTREQSAQVTTLQNKNL